MPDATGRDAFVQTGTTTVLPLSFATNTLRIDPATVTLANLLAGSTNLVLSPGAGGTATGNLTAANLLVLGSGGSTTLFGTVAGQTGFNAAYVSQISPSFNVNYLLNGCAIASVTCAPPVPAPAPIPVAPPLVIADFQSFILPLSFLRPDILTLDVLNLSVTRDRDDPTLLLPNISDRDY